MATGTYLAGVDLLTTKGIVVGTHDGCFSCGTGAGVGFLASIVFDVQSDDFGRVGASGSCDLEKAFSAGKRVAAWQMMEKGLGKWEREQYELAEQSIQTRSEDYAEVTANLN